MKDYEEGMDCIESGCDGTLEYIKDGSCSCHMGNPPCSVCVDATLTCNKCGDEPNEDAEMVQWPAKYTVFWPGQTVHCCQAHYDGIVQLSNAMSMPVPDRREEEGNQCENCVNAAKKVTG